MMKINQRKGFTLIELLVVMAIILILAGLLTPGLFRAKQQAGKVNCANNLKQCGVAMELYASQNSDTYPTTTAQLATALDNTAVLQCPAASVAYSFTFPTAGTASSTAVVTCAQSAHGTSAAVTLYKGGYVKIK